MTSTAVAWANEEFGSAELGDPRRVRRLVSLATAAALTPAGTVTGVLTRSADREGAFRFLQSKHVASGEVARASHEATVRRCQQYPWVYVPMDGSSIALTDRAGVRDVGQVGTWRQGARGLIVASALAVSPDGSPLGLSGQRFWARTESSLEDKRTHRRVGKETGYGVELLAQVHERFEAQNRNVQPWFQLDRGYDAWGIWRLARDRQPRLTVRACHDRCIRGSKHDKPNYLFAVGRRAPVVGTYNLLVAERPDAPARVARMQVRTRSVTIELRVSSKKREYITLNVVVAQEMRRNGGLHWTLLTTAAVQSFDDALTVLNGYAARWRIEEFHRAWKRGVCNVEDTQLQGREGIIKWATILAAVAARATRLTYLARERPDSAATEELSRDEIDATIALLQPKGIKPGAEPTLAQVVRWIADLGGYTGKSSGGPPGPTVIARGLQKVEILAEGIRNLAKMR